MSIRKRFPDDKKKMRYVVNYYDPSGTRVYKSFLKLQEAKDFDATVRTAKAAGTYVATSRLSLREFYDKRWAPTLDAVVAIGDLKPNTAAYYKEAMTLRALPQIGNRKLAALGVADLEKLSADLLATGLSRSTVHGVEVAIHKMLAYAVRIGELPRNVSSLATKTRVDHPEANVYDVTQLRALLVAFQAHRMLPVIHLAVTTGLRRGEMAALRWPDLDLDAGELHVRATRLVIGGKISEGVPKTARSRRSVGIDPATVKVMRTWQAKQAEERLRAGQAWEGNPDPREGYVFTDEHGRPYDPARITRTFQRIATKAGLPLVPFHNLRHSFASAALEAGTDLTVLSRALGHASTAITSDVYQSVSERLRQTAANTTALHILGSSGEQLVVTFR